MSIIDRGREAAQLKNQTRLSKLDKPKSSQPAVVQSYHSNTGTYTVRQGANTITGCKAITNGQLSPGQTVVLKGNLIDQMRSPRPISPTSPTAPTASARIQYLYSVIEDGDRAFYLGGYAPIPQFLNSFPLTTLLNASLDNLGGSEFLVVFQQFGKTESLSSQPQHTWTLKRQDLNPIYPFIGTYRRYGFFVSEFWVETSRSKIPGVLSYEGTSQHYAQSAYQGDAKTFSAAPSYGYDIQLGTGNIGGYFNGKLRYVNTVSHALPETIITRRTSSFLIPGSGNYQDIDFYGGDGYFINEDATLAAGMWTDFKEDRPHHGLYPDRDEVFKDGDSSTSDFSKIKKAMATNRTPTSGFGSFIDQDIFLITDLSTASTGVTLPKSIRNTDSISTCTVLTYQIQNGYYSEANSEDVEFFPLPEIHRETATLHDASFHPGINPTSTPV